MSEHATFADGVPPRTAWGGPFPTPRTVVLLGAKGGCGATTLAANLAGVRSSKCRLVLLDLDFYKGDVAGLLDLTPERTLHDLLVTPDRIDADLVRGLAAPYDGFWVLAQPRELERAMQVGADEVRRVLDASREAFDLVVADAGSRLDEPAAAAALHADMVVLVAAPETAALRDAGRTLDLLSTLGLPPERVRLVVNRTSTGGLQRLESAAQQLGVPLVATITRDDETCAAADLSGQLLNRHAPKSRISQDLGALWGRLTGQDEPSPPRWSLSRAFESLRLSSAPVPDRLLR